MSTLKLREIIKGNRQTGPEDLTDRQWDVLEFIRKETIESGKPPTVREIGTHFDIKSPNGVQCHLKALVKKGFLVKHGKHSRGLALVVPEGCCAACGRPLDG